jgi:hypothetical protein
MALTRETVIIRFTGRHFHLPARETGFVVLVGKTIDSKSNKSLYAKEESIEI